MKNCQEHQHQSTKDAFNNLAHSIDGKFMIAYQIVFGNSDYPVASVLETHSPIHPFTKKYISLNIQQNLR